MMRSTGSVASLMVLLTASCAIPTTAYQERATSAEAVCEPEAIGALIARPIDLTGTGKGHTVIARHTLSFVDSIFVKGPCVREIAYFNSGLATLSSGHRFAIEKDGTIQPYPPMPPDRNDVAVEVIQSLSGYDKIMADRTRIWRTPAGTRESYLGAFKSKSDYVIARFEVLNGEPSREAEILIQSRSPLVSVDYLPAPDTPTGRIGFVQRAGTDQAWLYSYDWHHGAFRPLAYQRKSVQNEFRGRKTSSGDATNSGDANEFRGRNTK